MQIKNLYKYERLEGGETVSPIKPDVPYTLMYRVIADEGMLVTRNGIDTYPCIDTYDNDGWYEVEDTERMDADA